MKFDEPEIEIIAFASIDVISDSKTDETGQGTGNPQYDP